MLMTVFYIGFQYQILENLIKYNKKFNHFTKVIVKVLRNGHSEPLCITIFRNTEPCIKKKQMTIHLPLIVS